MRLGTRGNGTGSSSARRRIRVPRAVSVGRPFVRGVAPAYLSPAMLHYFKFRQDLFAPAPARDVYVKRGAGKGWPEECPPVRAANAFGFDLLANFDVTFVRSPRGKRSVEPDVVIQSDFEYAANEDAPGKPLA